MSNHLDNTECQHCSYMTIRGMLEYDRNTDAYYCRECLPKELTLEDALAHLWAKGWFMRPAVLDGVAYEWILYTREGGTIKHSFSTWWGAAESVLNCKVVPA